MLIALKQVIQQHFINAHYLAHPIQKALIGGLIGQLVENLNKNNMKVKKQVGVKKIISFTDFDNKRDFVKWQQDMNYEIIRFDTVSVDYKYSYPAAGSDGYGHPVSSSQIIAITRVYYYVETPVYKEADVKDQAGISNIYQTFNDEFTIGAKYAIIDSCSNEYFGEFQDGEIFITSMDTCDLLIHKCNIKQIKTI